MRNYSSNLVKVTPMQLGVHQQRNTLVQYNVSLSLVSAICYGVQLVGPSNYETFVRLPLDSHYAVLNCQKSSKHIHTACQSHRLEQNCETGLVTRDLPKIVKPCKFSKVKSVPSVRLADKIVLVMDKLAKVKVHNSIDESQVMIQVLYLVHNVREMIIESERTPSKIHRSNKYTRSRNF